MKKFYFLMIAMVISVFSASAIDYYLIGGFNDWGEKDANCKFTNQGDGTYILNYQGTLTSGFKINDGTWNNPSANFGGSATLVPGKTYSLVVNGGNIPITENIVNPTVVLNPTAKTLLITGEEKEAVIAYALSGRIFGGDWKDVVMTESEGNWVLSTRTFVAGDFGIKKIDADTKSQIDWISASGSTTVVINQPMSCKVEGSDFTLTTGGEYTVTYDPEAMTILFAGDGGDTPEPVEPDEPTTAKFGIVGSMQEPTNWNISSMFEMTEEADGTFSYHFDSLDKDAAFKIGTIGGTWDDTFGAESNEPSATKIPVTVGKAMNAWKGSSNDFIISEALTDVTITFTYAEAGPSTVTVTAKSEEPVEPIEPTTTKFGIVGSMQEPTIWDIDNMLEMTEAEGVYTYTFDELAEGTTFKIGTVGGTWDDTFGAENPDTSATQATDIPVTVGEAMNAWKKSSNNFLITEALTDVTITFTYVEAGPSTVTVTGTVESPEPIEPDDPDPVEPDNFTAQFDFEKIGLDYDEVAWQNDSSNGNVYISVVDLPITVDGVSITTTKGTENPRIYKVIKTDDKTGITTETIDLRTYKGSTTTIAAPANHSITEVVIYSAVAKSTSKLEKLTATGWINTGITSDLPTGIKYGVSFTPAARTASSELVISNPSSNGTTRINYIDVTVTKMTTGVEEVISVVNDAPVEYYNLNGVRVSEPSNGIYIRRQGNEVTKVIIK